jgi:hypothetical protein
MDILECEEFLNYINNLIAEDNCYDSLAYDTQVSVEVLRLSLLAEPPNINLFWCVVRHIYLNLNLNEELNLSRIFNKYPTGKAISGKTLTVTNYVKDHCILGFDNWNGELNFFNNSQYHGTSSETGIIINGRPLSVKNLRYI